MRAVMRAVCRGFALIGYIYIEREASSSGRLIGACLIYGVGQGAPWRLQDLVLCHTN